MFDLLDHLRDFINFGNGHQLLQLVTSFSSLCDRMQGRP